jgi:hypothetical protein
MKNGAEAMNGGAGNATAEHHVLATGFVLE